ncbi:hypothetical protein [Aquimarina sp. 2304DJ70-9]|uniref:hypothetical protein n=1 Tax=Aquimarina penaris TaxID=3231044 RepID=UPI0034626FFA
MKHFFFFLLIICSFIIRGQEGNKILDSLILETKRQDSIIKKYADESELSKQEPKPLRHSGSIKLESNKSDSIFQFIFPSLIAIFVGLIALYGTIHTGKKQRKLSERQLNNQLSESKKTVDAQIKSSKEILEKQINSADKNAELIFRQNVLSNNRQNWINKLRDVISEMMPLVSHMGLTKVVPHEEYKKFQQLIFTAELMVNPEKDKNFIDALKKLRITMLKATKKDAVESDLQELWKCQIDVLELTKKTLKTEWERVKKGE